MSGSGMLKGLLGAVVFVGIFWFLYLGILANHATTKTTRFVVPSTRTLEHWKLVGRETLPTYHDSNLYYVSKRRVPNGPDPIHNRRVSQSRQPPGRS